MQSDLPISLDADTTEFDRRADEIVFRGLRISQGALGIEADLGRASRLDFEDSRWEFSGSVRITDGDARLASDRASLRFDGHELINAVVTGDPATFVDTRLRAGEPVRGRAGQLEYDLAEGVLRLSGGAWLSEGANEISGASLTYDIEGQRVLAESDESGERVRITITPPPEEADEAAEGAAIEEPAGGEAGE
jgi:lipopolysaccharide export system protein LptA